MRPPTRKLRVESLSSLRARILVNDNSVSKPKARITSASRSEAWAGLATLVGTALDLRNSDEAKGFQALIRIAEWTGRGCGEIGKLGVDRIEHVDCHRLRRIELHALGFEELHAGEAASACRDDIGRLLTLLAAKPGDGRRYEFGAEMAGHRFPPIVTVFVGREPAEKHVASRP